MTVTTLVSTPPPTNPMPRDAQGRPLLCDVCRKKLPKCRGPGAPRRRCSDRCAHAAHKARERFQQTSSYRQQELLKSGCEFPWLHTPCPSGYVQWSEWSERKMKLYRLKRCPHCGQYAIWVLKRPWKWMR